MRSDDKPVAVLCADIHLSMNPPVARRSESNWFTAMGRTLDQIGDLARDLSVPVICAGDIFDRWNSPPELINFALHRLPMMYAIPGQHDLPFHRMDFIEKSAYWTLVMADKIQQLTPAGIDFGPFCFYGFGWNQEIGPPDYNYDKKHIAVVHSFIWTGDYGYQGAPEEARVKYFRKKLEGYSAAVFGDNHKGFLTEKEPHILNCGTLFRRKSDEIDYRPSVGVLYASGRIVRHELDISGECMERVAEEVVQSKVVDFGEFLDRLGSLSSDPLNFVEVLERAMEQSPEGVRNVLRGVMG